MKSQLRIASALSAVTLAALVLVAASAVVQEPKADKPAAKKAEHVQVEYLEIVTPDVDAACTALEKLHGVTFGKPILELGKARTAKLEGGGRVGVRAPMGEAEKAVVRPYVLTDDIEAAVKSAEAAGAEIAHPPQEIPGQGTFAIYFQGGIEYGLWQN